MTLPVGLEEQGCLVLLQLWCRRAGCSQQYSRASSSRNLQMIDCKIIVSLAEREKESMYDTKGMKKNRLRKEKKKIY